MRRARPRFAQLSALGAMSLSLCVLAACTTPRASLVATSIAANTASPAGAPVPDSGGTATAQAAVSFTAIQGRATFHGQPLANAELRVTNALTNAPAGVIAAGGGNLIGTAAGNVIAAGGGNVIAAGGGNVIAAGGGNVIAAGGGNLIGTAAGNLRTDAEGNFNVNISGLTGGNAARLVVVAGGNAISTLVTGGAGLTGRGYRTLQADGSGGVAINEVTTTVSHLANGVLKLSRMLKPDAAAPVIASMMAGLQAQTDEYARVYRQDPQLANRLVEETDPATGAPRAVKTSVVPTLIGSAGTRKAVFDLNKQALAGIARAAADPATQAPDLAQVRQEVQGVPLAGTGLSASADEGAITLATSNGQSIALSLTDSAQLDTTLSSGGFEQTFTPPAPPSGGGDPAPTPAEPSGPIAQVAAFSGLPAAQAGAFARQSDGHFWLIGANGAMSRWNPDAPQAYGYVASTPGAIACALTDYNLWAALPAANAVVSYSTATQPSGATFTSPTLADGTKLSPAHLTARAGSPLDVGWLSDPGKHHVARFTASGTWTPVNVSTLAFAGVNVGITRPEGLGTDSAHRVWIVSGQDQKLLVLGDDGSHVATHDLAALVPDSPFSHPTALAVDASDRVWFCDGPTDRVALFSPTAPMLTTFDVPAPEAVAADGSRVWVLSPSLKQLTVVDPAAAEPVVSLTLPFTPGGLSVRNGEAYVTDLGASRVVAFRYVP